MAVGNSIILASGAFWLSAFIGAKSAFQLGVAPFLVPEVVTRKAVVVILTLPTAWRFIPPRK